MDRSATMKDSDPNPETSQSILVASAQDWVKVTNGLSKDGLRRKTQSVPEEVDLVSVELNGSSSWRGGRAGR